MNIEDAENESTKRLSFVSFTQNFGSVVIGTETSWKSFKIKSPIKVKIEHDFDHEKEIHLFERLRESNLAALVFSESSSSLSLFDLKSNAEICQLDFVNRILAVKLNSKRVVTMTTVGLCIHDIHCATHVHTIPHAPGFSNGVLAISNNTDVCYVAYSEDSGMVNIFDAEDLHAISTISAHNNRIAALAFNSQGELLATASERGTVIRIFLTSDSTKLMEFRRGSSAVSIYSLSFSLDSCFLACSSNSRTVHVFKLDSEKKKGDDSGSGWLSYLGGALQHSASFLAADRLLPLKRSFATAHLTSAELKSTCAIASFDDCPYLLVATVEGWLNIYTIEENGGDCLLINQYKLDEFQRFTEEGFQIVGQKPTSLDPNIVSVIGVAFEVPSLANSSEDSCLQYAPVPKPSYANVVMNNCRNDGPRERREEARLSLREAADWEEASDVDNVVLELSNEEEFPSISDALKINNTCHFARGYEVCVRCLSSQLWASELSAF